MTITIDHVSKNFGDVVALSDVSATIEPGVTALLGPNGAGKSTLFRIIAGLTPPSIGTVRIVGADLRADRAARSRVSIVPQQDTLFEAMNGLQFVTLAAELCGVRGPANAAKAALDQVHLADVGSKPLRTYSKGMRQRIKIAAALVNQPEVLILDEPLNGLDPVQRGRMAELFRSLGEQGRTVLVSSHVLAEVAEIGSHVLIIVHGRLAASGDYRDLRRMMNDRPQLIQVTTDRPADFAALLVRNRLAMGVSVGADAVTVQTHSVDTFRRHIAALASANGLGLYGLANLDDDLDSVFAYLTGAPTSGGTP